VRDRVCVDEPENVPEVDCDPETDGLRVPETDGLNVQVLVGESGLLVRVAEIEKEVESVE
jgi:hypothetical protein